MDASIVARLNPQVSGSQIFFLFRDNIELIIILAGIQQGVTSGIWYGISTIMIINILFSVGYYLRIIQIIMLREPTDLAKKAKEVPAPMLFSMIILAILCIVIGIYPGPFADFANQAAEAALNLDSYVRVVIG